jgi:hypothetical protein
MKHFQNLVKCKDGQHERDVRIGSFHDLEEKIQKKYEYYGKWNCLIKDNNIRRIF